MVHRRATVDGTRQRTLTSARDLLLARNFSEFSMEAVARKAGVTRLTIYHQFKSKTGLLEELYNHIARRGNIGQLAEVFQKDNDPLRTLHDFVRVFAEFWASDRDVIRRLHGLGAIDAEIGTSLQLRNERRRKGAQVVVERYGRIILPFTPLAEPIAIDTLHMLTSFETYDALAVPDRKHAEVVEILQKMCDRAIGFTPRFVRR